MLVPEGTSLNHGREELIKALRPFISQIKTVVDFGCGKGKMGKGIRKIFGSRLHSFHAVDVWKPNIELHKTSGIYTSTTLGRVEELYQNFPADLWVFGDVLEHFEKREAIDIMNSDLAKFKLIRIPYGEWPQKPSAQGNFAEIHVWSFKHSHLCLVHKEVLYHETLCSDQLSSSRKIPKRIDRFRDVDIKDKRFLRAYMTNLLLGLDIVIED